MKGKPSLLARIELRPVRQKPTLYIRWVCAVSTASRTRGTPRKYYPETAKSRLAYAPPNLAPYLTMMNLQQILVKGKGGCPPPCKGIFVFPQAVSPSIKSTKAI